MREADVAIRMSPPRQPDLVQRHLMTVRHHAYASADYLKKHGTPQRPEELDKHRIIVYGTDSRPPIRNPNWLLEAGARPGYERHPILAVNNLYAILRALQAGLGIASLPDFMEHETAGLVRVLPDVLGGEFESFFVYPEELRTSKRIAVFRDFLLRKVAERKNGSAG
jgi:DNA-binding transcriptional LysR family regulator